MTRSGSVAVLFYALAGQASAEEVEYNRDIRPILAENCFRCHGPDKAARKADLRLDQRDVAIAAGVILPDELANSPLVLRVLSDDEDFRMPPPISGKTLTLEQKDLLRRWVEAGAQYQENWSFLKVPRQVTVPEPEDPDRWIRDPIDAFVLERLLKEGLPHAAESSREKWLRRVTFDLTGLPPTLAEIDAFLADGSKAAFEVVADRLLQSPAYGERMAGEWLDGARYADTFGYQNDRDTHLWPWRDWLIRAFNDNLPYDEFVLWQTAGDLLERPTRDQILATAFNRLHRQTNEGGSVEEEFRVAYVADRVQTNATVFLGLTVECARCHDHKYDPISQRDFYAFSAFFDNIDEHGLYSHFTETAPTPAQLLYEGDQEERHRALRSRIAEQEAELDRVRTKARERIDPQRVLAPVEPPTPAAQFRFEDAVPSGDISVIDGKRGKAVQFGGDDAFVCTGAGAFGRADSFSFALWLKPAAHQAREIVVHRSVAAEDSAYRGYSLVLDQGRAVFSMIHFWPGNALRVQTRAPLPVGEWTHLVVTHDGSSRAAGIRAYLNGSNASLEVVRDALSRDIVHRPEWGDSGAPELSLGARFRDVGFKGGVIDEFLVFDRELTALEVRLVALEPGFEVGRGTTQDGANDLLLFDHHLLRHDEPYRTAAQALEATRKQENELEVLVRQIMVMKEQPWRRPTHVLERGDYGSPREPVGPDTPAPIFPFPADYPRNRLGLARWLIDERNPLVSRVAVNRLWQMFFGRGLVATPEDFGTQGQPPSHPELLDWLARAFIDSGWDQKQLCRRIVRSATYRQSSVPEDVGVYATDPENRLLARGPRHRLSGEQIRDNALAVSGLFDRRIGGPPVMPYQPAGLWEEAGTGKSYAQSKGADLYRRSLYTFWRRTSPPPAMISFDAPTREVCTARRERTATPLQALLLLNDPQFVEAARVLAEKLIVRYPDATLARIEEAFRVLTSRRPSLEEMDVLSRLYDEQRAHFASRPDDARALLSVGESARDESMDAVKAAATTVVVQSLMSFDECVTKR